MATFTTTNYLATIKTDERGFTTEINDGTLCNGNTAYVVQTCNTYGTCVHSETFDNLPEALAWANS